MEYLFLQRPGDREKILEFLSEHKQCTKQELVERYNRNVDIGIVGAHGQAQILVALYHAFILAFGKSPVKIEANIIISLTEKIEMIGEDWQYSSRSKTQ